MRRTVATLLVVASPLLVAVPVGAAEGPSPGRAVPAPAVAPPAAVPPAPVNVARPAVNAPVAPALSAAAAVVGPASAQAAAPVHPVARTLRRATVRFGDLDAAAYAARLQADLCQARTIFCGLDRGGRYPAH